MAALRCFHPPSRSNAGKIFRQESSFPFKFFGSSFDSEHMAFYLKKQKLEVHPMRVRYSHLKRLNPSMIESLCSQKETFQFCSSEWFLHMILGICPWIGSVITDHQVKNCAKVLVFAHSLTFFFPLDVLAETCESDSSYFNMPLLFIIALIGATVGGLLARQRRGELKRLNEQLRQINAALRRQAKIESYAPKLSYAPVGRTPEAELLVDPKKEQLIAKLRTGKNFLRNQELEKAFVEFKAALDLAAALEDRLEEKKAARGLGASLQRQGKYKEAIKYHSKVLEIANKFGEDSGVTEAYGAIADCYTELGDLEKAGKFYDKYIARLEKD